MSLGGTVVHSQASADTACDVSKENNGLAIQVIAAL